MCLTAPELLPEKSPELIYSGCIQRRWQREDRVPFPGIIQMRWGEIMIMPLVSLTCRDENNVEVVMDGCDENLGFIKGMCYSIV